MVSPKPCAALPAWLIASAAMSRAPLAAPAAMSRAAPAPSRALSAAVEAAAPTEPAAPEMPSPIERAAPDAASPTEATASAAALPTDAARSLMPSASEEACSCILSAAPATADPHRPAADVTAWVADPPLSTRTAPRGNGSSDRAARDRLAARCCHQPGLLRQKHRAAGADQQRRYRIGLGGVAERPQRGTSSDFAVAQQLVEKVARASTDRAARRGCPPTDAAFLPPGARTLAPNLRG